MNVHPISIASAEDTIHLLRLVESRLDEGSALSLHLGWAREAVWAAAYPDDPHTLLEIVADLAEQAD